MHFFNLHKKFLITGIMRTKIIFILFFFSIFALSCRSSPQGEKMSLIATESASDNQTVQHLIADYSGMKEDASVASAWIAANFTLEDCAEVSVQPVLNYSRMYYSHAQERIEASLRDSIAAKKKNPAGKSVVITAAITGMRGKPSIIKRLSMRYDDTPSIELEVVVSETQSKQELVKFCHMARAKDPDQALNQLLRDVKTFINKKLSVVSQR